MPKIATDFQGHLSFTQTGLTFSLKIAAVLIATFSIFFRDLAVIFTDASQNEVTSYILILPFILIYLIYRKRKMLKAVMSPNEEKQSRIRYLGTAAGILLTVTSVQLYWYGSQTFMPLEYHMFALPLFVAGLLLIMFNPEALRQLAFPIVFLFFFVPPPTEILYAAGSALQILSAESSSAIMNLLRIPSQLTAEYGNPIITITRPDSSTIPFQVDIACSGLYSLMGFTAFVTLAAYIMRDKLWKKAAIIMIGIPIIFLSNILRISTMLLIGYFYNGMLALQIFHLLGGWVLIFLGTIFILLISEKIFKAQIFSTRKGKCLRCNQNLEPNVDVCRFCGKILHLPAVKINKRDVGKIFAIILVASLLATIQVPVFALAEGPPIALVSGSSGDQMSTQVLPQTDQYTLSYLYRDTDFEALANQDMSLAYYYSPLNASDKPVWVALEIASTPSPLHRWEVCLITWRQEHGYGAKATQVALQDVQLRENPPIVSRYFVFKYIQTNITEAVLYWFETATVTTNSTSQEKYVKISLIGYPENMDELQDIEHQLTTLAKAITDYWHPIKTWSQIPLLISQNGIILSAATVTALTMTVIFYGLEVRKRKKECLFASRKLAKANREIVNSIEETKKPATLEKIAAALHRITGKEISTDRLQHRIEELEKTGIIRRSVYGQNDEPVQTWKI